MPAGGLGRGLSIILTGTSTAPPSRGSTADRVIERALTEMASGGPLRVCGHLDDPSGEADLTLRSPDLGSLHPTEAYQLFSALNGVDFNVPGRHDLDIGSHRAMAVVVERAGHRGLWFFGDDRLDDASIERLAQLAEAFGPAVCEHRRAPVEPDLPTVDLAGSDAHWSVRVRCRRSGETVEGTGVGTRHIDAAAAGVVDALGVGPAQIELDLMTTGNTAAVLAVLRLGPAIAVGVAEVAAPVDDATSAVAAAAATQRAARRLIRG